MMVNSGVLVILIPLLLIFCGAALLLFLGLRRGGDPTCRACDASVACFGDPLSECPSCAASLQRLRAVRFRGRRRPIWFRLLCMLVGLPTLVLAVTLVAVVTGTWSDPNVPMAMNRPGPLNGPISFAQAESLPTDELLAAVRTNPSMWGWLELRDRLEEDPNDQHLLEALAIVGETLQAADDKAAIPSTNDFDWVPTAALKQLGIRDEDVVAFMKTNLLRPPPCPIILPGKEFRFDFNRVQQSRISLLTYSGGFRTAMIVVGVSIDNTAIRSRHDDGSRTWKSAWMFVTLSENLISASALTPGTHEVKLDILSAVLPPGVEQSLDPDLWPASTIRSTSTITCSYTIKAEE